MLKNLSQIWKSRQGWFFSDIISPFLISRFALIIVGWFSQYFPINNNYPNSIISRGWHYSPHRMLDIWGRWDTDIYLSIIQDGYSVRDDWQTAGGNIAFFPLYPYIVKCLTYLVPESFRSLEITFLLGIVFSNIAFLVALVLLYELIVLSFQDAKVARRTVLYLLIFPTSFFFSCFYSESTFLLISVATFYGASKRAWLFSSICGGLLALTRPLGVMIIIPVVLMYLKSLNWRLYRIRWKAICFLLIPTSFFAFLLSIYRLTGELFAPMLVQQAWGRTFTTPWKTLINPNFVIPYISTVDLILTLAFLILALVSIISLKSIIYSIYSFLLLLPPLFTGSLYSMSRFLAVIFPIFITISFLAKKQIIHQFFTIIFLVLQVLFMVGWSQFFWVA